MTYAFVFFFVRETQSRPKTRDRNTTRRHLSNGDDMKRPRSDDEDHVLGGRELPATRVSPVHLCRASDTRVRYVVDRRGLLPCLCRAHAVVGAMRAAREAGKRARREAGRAAVTLRFPFAADRFPRLRARPTSGRARWEMCA